eukprot:TRINITY_DN3918_c0_g1_i1.p1 TRINITY_DN3918_c0_g1~~TRINITY_DN3918_c0_g1_i1.p1  ORF type:complete len:253 (+),score=88.52 TRINITY_DN3918_c0_g1_i1:54-761(+)
MGKVSNLNKYQDKDLQDGLDQFRCDLAEDALEIISNKIPHKIFSLNNLIKENSFFQTQPLGLSDSSSDKKRKIEQISQSRVGLFEDLPVEKSNTVLLEMMRIVKSEIMDLVELIRAVRVWVRINVPQIEDGNNFGVEVQMETYSGLYTIENHAMGIVKGFREYYLIRARLVAKSKEYPQIEDYVKAIRDIDDRQYFSMRLAAMEMRNSFASGHDLVVKNLEKIKKPKSSDMNNFF